MSSQSLKYLLLKSFLKLLKFFAIQSRDSYSDSESVLVPAIRLGSESLRACDSDSSRESVQKRRVESSEYRCLSGTGTN